MARYYPGMDQENPRSFDAFKAIYDAGKSKEKATKGVQLIGDTRIFKNRNGSFTVRHVQSRSLGRYGRGRYIGDQHIQKIGDTADFFTVFPDGKFTIHCGLTAINAASGYNNYYYGGNTLELERLADFTPLRGVERYSRNIGAHLYAIHPDFAKGEPKPKKLPKEVMQTQYIPKGHRLRANYEAALTEFGGDWDKWYIAYTKYDAKRRKIEDANYAALREWQNKAKITPFVGMVIDSNGIVSKRSYDRFNGKVNALKKVERERRRKQEQEWEKERIRNAKKREKRLKQERAAAEKHVKAERIRLKKLLKDQKLAETLDASVLQWIKDRNITVNPDGTVRMVKAVRLDFTSRYGTLYKPETRVIAPDYSERYGCGQGLHFSETYSLASRFDSLATKSLVVHVDLASLVPMGDKVKAEWCDVICEGDEKTVLPKEEKKEAVDPKRAAKDRKNAAARAKRAAAKKASK